jgi:hypothetical protein
MPCIKPILSESRDNGHDGIPDSFILRDNEEYTPQASIRDACHTYQFPQQTVTRLREKCNKNV